MDGKEESLYTDGNSFLVLHNHYVYNGNKGTFLMANKTNRAN